MPPACLPPSKCHPSADGATERVFVGKVAPDGRFAQEHSLRRIHDIRGGKQAATLQRNANRLEVSRRRYPHLHRRLFPWSRLGVTFDGEGEIEAEIAERQADHGAG